MKPRFEPSPPEATQAALDMAVQPFVEKFVRTDKRERATTLYLPKQAKASWHELIGMVDTHRARPCTPEALAAWDAVTGVLLVAHEAYTVSAKEAMSLYLTEDAVFAAYRGTFAVIRYTNGQPLLLT